MITGCDSGIGKETAIKLAAEGWRVFAGVFTEAGLQLGQASPAIHAIPLDVTSQESIQAAAQVVAAAVGADGLQLLVNNAGIGSLAPAECLSLQEFRRVLEVNVVGVLATCQAFLPLLRAGQHKGRIVHLGSVAGHLPMPHYGPYSASKHALEGLSDCMAFELAPQGIKVVLVKPGPAATPIWQSLGTVQQRLAQVITSKDKEQLYGADFESMLRESEKAGAAGCAASDVAAAILDAATSAWPHGRYHVGPNAALYHWLRRLLPDEVWFSTMQQALAKEVRKERSRQYRARAVAAGAHVKTF
ncbi:hypothetical protein OEZ85_012137 [Tetradesmus obliquus]|uniref:Uncharacterized protein n=1 Tax=Tetradesmus obliquus TaxID=3088 RepID=A0ABY8TSJ5_TETOB|nr:hypothetical protein OEZ85_012137 [Tetradesmus obliquus]